MAQETVGETSIRQVWNRRQHEVQTASYQVTWIEITFDKRGSQRSEGAMDAAMAFDNKRFRFDTQGIMIIPRHVAWKHGELKAYASADFGMTIDVLRDTLYRSARPDEWDDVGGPASMMVDKDSGTVMVMHAQSEHIRLSRKLQQIVKEASK